jgi:photosystem II stability/assembly factor-like uncharacterized protein
VWLGSVPVPATAADNTWTPALVPSAAGGPVLALAVSPVDGRQLLAGTAAGVVYRSTDGGGSWSVVKRGLGRGVATLAFDSSRTGVVWAGTWDAGLWRSIDAGQSWRQAAGTEGRVIRAVCFVSGMTLAGGDQGVVASSDGVTWEPSGLPQVQVAAFAVAQDGPGTSLVLAGGDGSHGGEPLPLFGSHDAGRTWAPVAGAAGAVGAATMVSALATASAAGSRTVVMGTNAGLFQSPDQGASWPQLTGGGVLPATDFTALAAAPASPDRLYVASDGGGSDRGGLWVTTDGGAHFASLLPPDASVTALAASGDPIPRLLVATYRPTDHAVAVWTYRDAGGQPGPPAGLPRSEVAVAPAGAAAGPAPPTPAPVWSGAGDLLSSPEVPFAAISGLAVLIVVAALLAHVRRRPPG